MVGEQMQAGLHHHHHHHHLATHHTSSHQDGQLKRKRSPTTEDEQRSKRSSHPAELIAKDIDLREKWRKQIRAVFTSYSTLTVPTAAGNGTNQQQQGLSAFQALLEAGSGGATAATRRLAARLIPRFLSQFPHQVDQAATTLMALRGGGLPGHPTTKHNSSSNSAQQAAAAAAAALVPGPQEPPEAAALLEASAAEALQGLGHVLEAAVALVDKAVPTVLRVVDYLLRQINIHTCNEQLHKPKHEKPDAAAAGGPLHRPSEFPVVQELLQRAFRLFPRVVLSCCLQAFRSGDTTLYPAALWFCNNQLLKPPLPATPPQQQQQAQLPAAGDDDVMMGETAAAAAAAATSTMALPPSANGAAVHIKVEEPHNLQHEQHRAAGASDGGGASSDSKAASGQVEAAAAACSSSSSSNSSSSSSSSCLAKEVLDQLPDTQQWLRQAIAAVSKDKRVLACSREVHVLIDQLLKLTAVNAPPPPPPPPPTLPPHEQQQQQPQQQLQQQQTTPSKAQQQQQQQAVPMDMGSPEESDATAAAADAMQISPARQHAAAATEPPPPPPPPPPPSLPDQDKLGEQQQQQVPPSNTTPAAGAPASDPLTPLAVAGGPVTRADCCLHLANLPPALSETSLKARLSSEGAAAAAAAAAGGSSAAGSTAPAVVVDSVHLGHAAQLPSGEAYVVFRSVREAALCGEALSGTMPWGGSRPLRCQFCPGLPAQCPMRAREGPGRPAASYIWCAGLSPPEHLVAAIRQAGLTIPQAMLKVGGSMPGFLLDMPSPASCQPVIDLLRARFAPPGTVVPPAAPHILLPPPPPPPPPHQAWPAPSTPAAAAAGALPPPPPPAAQQQQQQQQPQQYWQQQQQAQQPQQQQQQTPALASQPSGGNLLQRQSSLLTPAANQGDAITPASLTGASSSRGAADAAAAAAAAAGVQVHAGMRTLWVGQVHDSISEDALVSAFRQHGPVASYRLLRSSHCAFIDFVTHAAAAAAHKALNGARVAGHVLRVEWKVDPNASKQQHAAPATPASNGAAGDARREGGPGRTFSFSMGPGQHAASASATPAATPTAGGGASAAAAGGSSSAAVTPMHLQFNTMPPSSSARTAGPSGFSGAPSPFTTPAHHHQASTSPYPPPPLLSQQSQQQALQHQHSGAHLQRSASIGGGALHPAYSLQPLDSGAAGAGGGNAAAAAAGAMTGAPPPGRALTPQPAAAHAANHSSMEWRGVLAKSGAPVCTLMCTAAAASSDATTALATSPEPYAWPSSLNVTMRVHTSYVVQTLWPTTPAAQRAVRRLVAVPEDAAAGGGDRLANFVKYLADKGRAGVIKLDTPGLNGGAARTLYLMPPSQSLCSLLGVSWEPRRDAAALLALCLPTPAAAPSHK